MHIGKLHDAFKTLLLAILVIYAIVNHYEKHHESTITVPECINESLGINHVSLGV